MNARELAIELRHAMVGVKNQGNNTIEADSLITYLDSVIESDDSDPSPSEMELYRAQLQLSTERYRAEANSNLEMFKSVILAGQNALRTAFLLNGGASIALLAVIGKMVSEPGEKMVLVSGLADSLIMFVIGTFAIALASGITYLSQWFFGGEKDWQYKTGRVLNIAAILVGLLSFGFFIWGMLRAYNIFQV